MKMTGKTGLAAATVAALMLGACGNGNGSEDPSEDPTSEEITTGEDVTNGEGFGNHRDATDDERALAIRTSLDSSIEVSRARGGDNTLISPASLTYAQAIAGEGAQCETESEINEFLGVEDDARRSVYSQLGQQVNRSGDEWVTSLSSAIAHNEEETLIKTDFVSDVAGAYGSEFMTDTVENLQPELDAWVDEATGGLQTELPSPVAENTALSFVSAVRYETRWAGGVSSTSIEFTTLDGSTEDVDGYHFNENAEGWRVDGGIVVRLPTESRDSTYLYYPDDVTDPLDLTSEDWDLDRSESIYVDLTLPAIDLESTTDILEYKEEVGLANLDDSTVGCGLADYSESENVFISVVVQNATFTLDDEGIAASAVTQIDAVDGAAPYPAEFVEVTVDRPYALLTVSDVNGWALMYATVTNPAAS
ncbi:MAG: serpin family protein [Flaviflexus sp.]|uniref:serpin family protein n=1 Tax=Flaviflexus sp. TaxID=1969482 RepID=UPI00352D109A